MSLQFRGVLILFQPLNRRGEPVVAGVVLGMGIALLVSFLIGGAVPFTIPISQSIVFSVVLLAVAVPGTVLPLLRIARVDPLDAINKVG